MIRSEVTSNYKEVVMSAKSVFKMGFLSMIVAIGLFGASNGFADTGHTTSNSEGVRANTGVKAEAFEATADTQVVSADVQIPETPAPRHQVVDSEGNIYRLTPLQTQRGSPQDAKTLPLYPSRRVLQGH